MAAALREHHDHALRGSGVLIRACGAQHAGPSCLYKREQVTSRDSIALRGYRSFPPQHSWPAALVRRQRRPLSTDLTSGVEGATHIHAFRVGAQVHCSWWTRCGTLRWCMLSVRRTRPHVAGAGRLGTRASPRASRAALYVLYGQHRREEARTKGNAA